MTPEEHLSVDEEEGWVRVQRADWREDAVYALKAPAFLRPVETARLDAIATLRKEAAAAAQSVLPSTTQQLEICLWPAFSKYAEDVFDKMAEAKLGVSGRGGPRAYRRWLRSKCLSAVVDDVCRPVLGQFPITIRHVVEIIGERQSPEIERTRRALRGMLTEVIGGPFTENLNRCLTAHLEGRGPYWEARAARPLPATTANDVNRMNRGAEAYHQGEHKTPAEIDPTHAIAERAGRRQAVVMPILAKKRWKRGRLATEAGVGKNSVYQYLDGTRVKITKENRRALAEALELASEQLPA